MTHETQPENLDPMEQKQLSTKQVIKSLRKDMRRIIEFAIGERTLPGCVYKRTVADDQRLLWTLNNLRERIEKLQSKSPKQEKKQQ